jgi:sigma-B regulation protein RsbU (phosphoserine phosphatase)
MRLVKDDALRPEHAPHTPLEPLDIVSPLPALDKLVELQQVIHALQDEMHMLRRRDETLRYYMQRVDEEMRLAARLQQDFLPKSLPQVGRIRFHTLFRPANYVSGDLYDCMRLDESHVGLFICDAVGHGMPAALLTMFIKRALVTKEILPGGKTYRLLTPSETMRGLNESLIEQDLSQATYATALYGIVNAQTLELRLARGGHPSPALLRANGGIEYPAPDGALLGIFPEEPFTEAKVQLHPGDRLFVYSDGVETAFSTATAPEDHADTQSHSHGPDTHRWQHALKELRHLPADQLLSEFSEELDRQCGSLAPKDDITIILLEVK